MPVTVSADGKSIVTTKSEGKAMATIPDVCKIPGPNGAIPVPFPNIAESKDIKMGSILTKIDGGSVALIGSYCDKSSGDEAGVLGGIVSGETGGKAFFLNCSSTVKVEGRPVCRKTDMMIMNSGNTVSLSGMNQDDVEKPAVIEEREDIALEIELKDKDGNPMANERYLVMHSGKIQKEGKLDAAGKAKVEGLKGPGFKVRFPDQEITRKSN